MVHYYMYKKTNKIKKHRQIDKRFVIKFIAKQTNVQTNKQTKVFDIQKTHYEKSFITINPPPLKKERKNRQK